MGSKSLALPSSQVGPGGGDARVSRTIAARRTGKGIPWESIKEAVMALDRGRLLPQGVTIEKAVVACAKGAELGIPPMQAISTIHIINGRPTMEAKLMLGLAYRHLPTFDYQVVRWDRTCCALKGRRSPSHSWVEVSFDKEDAVAAGCFGKGNWGKYPKAMFLARASAMLCRAIAPDVFSGLYDPEEAAALPDEALDDLEPIQAVVIEDDEAEVVNPISDEPMVDAAPLDAEAMKSALREVWNDAERRPAMQAELDRIGVSVREVAAMPEDMLADLHAALCT